MDRLIIAISVAVMLLFFGTTVNAQTAEQIAEMTIASTVLLEMRDALGRSTKGTGFFVGNNLIATNYHVVNGVHTGRAKLVEQENRYDIQGVTAIDKDHDLAIISVETLNAPPLLLGDSDAVQQGQTIYAVGNPRGLEGTFSSGEISSIRVRGTPRIKDKVFQFTAAISRGSSGGAVVNRLGEVIGIVTETRDDGQNLNFAIPVNVLKILLTRVGPVREFPKDKSVPGYNEGLPLPIIFLFIGIPTFLLIWFLPIVKIEHWSVAVFVSIGFGFTKLILTGIVRSESFPNGVKSLLSSLQPIDIGHALGCEECILQLLPHVVIFPAYLVFIAILLGIANVTLKKFELHGFFSTFFVAFLIVICEYALRLMI